MQNLSYRNALKEDIGYLLWLRKETMDQHLINSGITLNQEEQVARINHLFDQARIIIYNGMDIGLLKTDEKEDMVEIVQVQIEPQYQGRGIGKQVINSVIERSLSQNKGISLSVLKENPARDLYLRMGFKIVGEEDASWMMIFDNRQEGI
jgi:ribosomal protein S18 acetylase RimI-like enzyme